MTNDEIKLRIRKIRHNYSRNADLMMICDALEEKIKDVDFLIEEVEHFDPDYFVKAQAEIAGR